VREVQLVRLLSRIDHVGEHATLVDWDERPPALENLGEMPADETDKLIADGSSHAPPVGSDVRDPLIRAGACPTSHTSEPLPIPPSDISLVISEEDTQLGQARPSAPCSGHGHPGGASARFDKQDHRHGA